MSLRILFIGDVVGAPGLKALGALLPSLVERTGAEVVVANGENAAGGLGITAETAKRMHAAGVHAITTGNHVWDKKEIVASLPDFPHLVRPANYPPGTPGRGSCVLETAYGPVALVNLAGRVFMDALECPFRTADRCLEELAGRARIVLVDFHAEATSEKRALGFYLDGRVTAVLGTHTHVPTADAQVLPQGTGYVSDVGMTGVAQSVIGVPPDRAIRRFLTQIPRSLGVAEGPALLCGALVTADESGRCLALERVEAR